MAYLYIFLQSNFLEVPFYFFLLRAFLPKSKLEAVFLLSLMNSLSHPIVFFGLMSLPMSYLSVILIAEIFAITSEAVFLHKTQKIPLMLALKTSTIANLVSWQLGPVLTYLIFS